jgi:membrane protease YdiL (CAAX protease family)
MRTTEPRRLWQFVAVVFLISYALQAVIWVRGGIEAPVFRQLAAVVMFVPGVTALLFLRRIPNGWRSIPWGLGRAQYLAYAAFLPAVMAVSLVAILSGLGLADSPHIRLIDGTVRVTRGLFVLGKGDQSILFFGVNLFLSSIALGSLNGLVTVGEEVGWRGFLQPGLLSRFRFALAIALVGFIWAHWHTPVILMGYNFPENPILGALLLWPATCICWSFVAAWLTLNGNSIWPAVVFHGSINAFLGGLVDGMTYLGPRWIAHLVILAAWLLVAALAFALTRKPCPPPAETSCSEL